MKIFDPIYGEYELEPVLAELINAKPVQRLKKIHQAGGCYLINSKWDVTRYDHSVGVMLLIRYLNGSILEQIAGLLHDISHTAFSHVVDYVLDNDEEDYHEKIVDKIVFSSEIPSILKKYDIDINLILDHSCWGILEQDLPLPCADRIDYTLRDMYYYQGENLENIQHFLNNLHVINNKIVIKNIEWAEWFTNLYYKEVIDFFLHPLNVFSNRHLTKILTLALEKEIIHLDDFLTDDFTVMAKLTSSRDKQIINLISKFDLNHNHIVESREDYEYSSKIKMREIDPLVNNQKKIEYASSISPQIKQFTIEAHHKCEKGTYVKAVGI